LSRRGLHNDLRLLHLEEYPQQGIESSPFQSTSEDRPRSKIYSILPLTASGFFLLIPTAKPIRYPGSDHPTGDTAISGRRIGTSGAYDGVPWGYISVLHPLMVTEVTNYAVQGKPEKVKSAAYVALATYWRRLAPPWHGTTLWE